MTHQCHNSKITMQKQVQHISTITATGKVWALNYFGGLQLSLPGDRREPNQEVYQD